MATEGAPDTRRIDDELAEARRIRDTNEAWRRNVQQGLNRPVGWITAKTWRERRRLRGWMLRRLESAKREVH